MFTIDIILLFIINNLSLEKYCICRDITGKILIYNNVLLFAKACVTKY